MRVSWQQIRHITYLAIYLEFERKPPEPRGRDNTLTVFGTHTCMDGECQIHGQTHIYTEWGLPDADAPLIRSIRDGDEFTYWIAVVCREEED